MFNHSQDVRNDCRFYYNTRGWKCRECLVRSWQFLSKSVFRNRLGENVDHRCRRDEWKIFIERTARRRMERICICEWTFWMCRESVNMRSTQQSVVHSVCFSVVEMREKWGWTKRECRERETKMVSTNPSLGVVTLNRERNTFRGVPKAEIERRTNTLLQAMTVSRHGNVEKLIENLCWTYDIQPITILFLF